MTRQLRLFAPETRYYGILKEFEQATVESSNVVVSFASIRESTRQKQATTRYQQLSLKSSLAEKFRVIVAETMSDMLKRLEDGDRIEEYEAGSGADRDTFEHVRLSEGDSISTQIAPLVAAKDLDPFSESKDFLAGLRYYVVSLQRADLPNSPFLHAFRFFSDSFILNRSRWVATFGAGYFDEVKEHGFLFDYQIDCLCLGEDMFILNKDKFQRMFRFYEYVQQDAKAFVYGLQDQVPIANIEEFVAACKRDPRMAMKLADLAEQPHVKELSMARIMRAIDRRGLPVKTVTKSGKEMLVYDTAYKSEFVRLLSDDYLRSQMTFLEYEVTGKRAIKKDSSRSTSGTEFEISEGSRASHTLKNSRSKITIDISGKSTRDLADVDE